MKPATLSQEDLLDLAERLDRMDVEVTDWEANFLNSILPQLREGRDLTPKQRESLLKMQSRYAQKGAV